jgi:MFS transporter, DHA1 family, putative efflux transporter
MSNTWKIYMLTLISFFVGTSQFVIVGILDKVAASVGVSVSAAGQLISVFALANAIGTPIVMVATAKMDRRKRLLLALAIILLGIVSTVALPGFGFLMVSYVVLGVGTGVFVVTAYATAANLAPARRQGRAMSNVSLGFSASLVFGVPIGRAVAAAYDWKGIFWGIGFFTLLGIFAVARTIPSAASEAPVPLGKQFALLKNPKIAFALGVTFFVFIGYSVMNTYITPFLTSVMALSEREVSVILFALGIASLIGSKLGGFLSDRIGTARTLVGDMVVHAFVLMKDRKTVQDRLSQLRSARAAKLLRQLKRLNKRLLGKIKLTLQPEADRTPVIKFIISCKLDGIGEWRIMALCIYFF